jgi:hypothetical protein
MRGRSVDADLYLVYPPPMSRARLAAVLVFLVSLGLAALILTDAVPGLRGPAPGTSVWYWPYLLRPVTRWWPAVGSAVLLVAAGSFWVVARPRSVWPLWLMVALGLALQLGLLYADRPNVGAELVDRTLSKGTSGYAAVAGELPDLNAAFADYPALMTTFDNEHARTHPPGLVAAFWLGDHALQRWPALAEWLAGPVRLWRCTDLWVLARPPATAAGLLVGSWLPVLAAGLVPVAAFYVARRLLRGPAIPLAASLSAVIPALLVFSPTPDQLFALLSLVALWALLTGLARRSGVWLFVAGGVLSVMTFLSIGNAAYAGLLGLFALGSSWRRGWAARDWVLGLGALAIGGASVWLIYWAGWGVAPWAIITTGLDQHYLLVNSQRDYLTWLAYNPLDLLLYAGLAVIVGWGGLTVAALARPIWRRSDAGLLALLLAAVLVVLLLSGGSRGEVGRLWLVFMPLAAVLAGGGWAAAAGARPLRSHRQDGNTPGGAVVALLLSAQVVLALAIGLAWRPLLAVILPVETPLMAALPGNLSPLDVAFTTPAGETLRLSGYALEGQVTPGGALGLHLAWAADGPTFDPYTVFVHVVDEAGVLLAQRDSWPVSGAWPTTCWRPGETISDPVELVLPNDLAPGAYTVLLGLYGGPDNERLQTADGLDAIVVDRFDVTLP